MQTAAGARTVIYDKRQEDLSVIDDYIGVVVALRQILSSSKTDGGNG